MLLETVYSCDDCKQKVRKERNKDRPYIALCYIASVMFGNLTIIEKGHYRG